MFSSDWCFEYRGKEAKCRPGQRCTDDELLPKAVEALRGKHVVDVCVGPSHLLAVTKKGAVYGWGCNENGQLGHSNGSPATFVTRPSRLNTPTVASAGCHVAAHSGLTQVVGQWSPTV